MAQSSDERRSDRSPSPSRTSQPMDSESTPAVFDLADIAALTLHYRPNIDSLRSALAPDLKTASHPTDDLFLLRYLLSASPARDPVEQAASGDLARASALLSTAALAKVTEVVRQGLAYRATHAAWIDAARDVDGVAPHSDKLGQHLVGAVHGATRDGAPVYIVRSAHTSAKALWSSGASVDDVAEWATFRKEVLFWRCDEITRKTGRLTKCIYVIDLKGSSVVQDIRGARAFGSSTKFSDFLHPQLIEKTIVLHPPATFRILYQFAKPFVSRKSISKICQCSATYKRGSTIADCPFVSSRLDALEVPSFMGGECRCNNGRCINDIPNDKKNASDTSFA